MPPAGCPPSGSARRQSTTRWPPNFLSLRRSANFTSVCGDLLELERGGLDDLNASPRGGNPTAALSEGPPWLLLSAGSLVGLQIF